MPPGHPVLTVPPFCSAACLIFRTPQDRHLSPVPREAWPRPWPTLPAQQHPGPLDAPAPRNPTVLRVCGFVDTERPQLIPGD